MIKLRNEGETMIETVNLLEEKNHYLEKFYKLNEKELINLADEKYDNIENFYACREGILRMIAKIDELIEQQVKLNEVNLVDEPAIHKKRMIKAFSYKNELVNLILSQDLQVISYIEKAKTVLIEELSGIQKEKTALKAYRVGNKL